MFGSSGKERQQYCIVLYIEELSPRNLKIAAGNVLVAFGGRSLVMRIGVIVIEIIFKKFSQKNQVVA